MGMLRQRIERGLPPRQHRMPSELTLEPMVLS